MSKSRGIVIGQHENDTSRIARGASLLAALCFVAGGLLVIWIMAAEGLRGVASKLIATYLLAWTSAYLFSDLSRRELGFRLAVMTLAILLATLMFEGLAATRLTDYATLFRNQYTEPWLRPDNTFDRELLWKRRPHTQLVGTTRGNFAEVYCLPAEESRSYPYELRYDHNGFRNASDVETASITVLGDSYTEAVNVPIEATLTSQLERISGLRVTNLGLSGYGPQQELIVLRRFALPLKPKVIVWAFYEGNDLQGMRSFELQTESLRAGRLRTGPTLRQRSFVKNVLEYLRRVSSPCRPRGDADRFFGLFRLKDDTKVKMYFREQPLAHDLRSSEPLPSLGQIIGEAYRLSAQRGALFVFLFVPAKYRVYSRFVEIPGESELWSWQLDDFAGSLRALVTGISANIGFLDLTDSLMAAAAEGVLVYFEDDSHLSPEGHRVAAKTLWSYLQEPLGQAASTPGSGTFPSSAGSALHR